MSSLQRRCDDGGSLASGPIAKKEGTVVNTSLTVLTAIAAVVAAGGVLYQIFFVHRARLKRDVSVQGLSRSGETGEASLTLSILKCGTAQVLLREGWLVFPDKREIRLFRRGQNFAGTHTNTIHPLLENVQGKIAAPLRVLVQKMKEAHQTGPPCRICVLSDAGKTYKTKVPQEVRDKIRHCYEGQSC